MNRKPFEITEVRDEATNVKTFLLDKDMKAKPGQYVIIWLPWDRLEETGSEKPFSISYTKPLGITVKKVGPFTKALFEKEEGNKVFVRGPLGNGFKMGRITNLHNVGGGTGIVSLALLAEHTIEYVSDSKVTSFLGAKSSNDLIFEDRLRKCGEIHISTEDRSKGKKGFVTDLIKEYEFPDTWFSKAAVCGPDKMMYNSVKILEKQIKPENIYLSLERLMKCGIGLCGSCGFGKYKMCVDGPVKTYKEIKDIPDFGNFKRDRCGRKEFL